MTQSSVPDPVFRSARREALVVALVWLASLVYSVGTCYALGYHRTVESLRFIAGFPDWVFWGIVIPWLGCLAITTWFTFGFMSDDSLGEDPGAGDVEPLPGSPRPSAFPGDHASGERAAPRNPAEPVDG